MNRILFEKDEIRNGVVTFGDERAEHIRTVLHGEVGQVLKTGEVNGKIGTGVIQALDVRPTGTVTVTMSVQHETRSPQPWIDLILAPPRPRVFKRLLPQLAALGVGRIFLVGAQKVEKDFWGATLLKVENYRPLLIDGLMQAGTSILPTLEIRRRFRTFVTDELERLAPSATRLVAHPGSHSTPCCAASAAPRPLIVAIGPEGGWTDKELALLEKQGFARYSLGPRVLKTETATVAIVAQLMQQFDR